MQSLVRVHGVSRWQAAPVVQQQQRPKLSNLLGCKQQWLDNNDDDNNNNKDRIDGMCDKLLSARWRAHKRWQRVKLCDGKLEREKNTFLQMHQFGGSAAQLDIKQQMSQPQHDLAADVCLSMRRQPTGFDLSRPLLKWFYFYIWTVVVPEGKYS